MFKKLVDSTIFAGKCAKDHYSLLKRKVIFSMFIMVTIPLTIMLTINYFQYKSYHQNQIMVPLQEISEKTMHSFELFLEQKLAIIKFISTTYNFESLKHKKTINKILISLKKEYKEFVDIGLIDSKGELISYAGPYSLLGKDYSMQISYKETQIKGQYISNVFLGYRKSPHIVIAVQFFSNENQNFILRATISTDFFGKFIANMGLARQSDAFLINSQGILQTNSLYYGNVLEKCPLKIIDSHFKPYNFKKKDTKNRDVVTVSSAFTIADYILAIVQPYSVALGSWYVFKNDMIFVFLISLGIILFAIVQLSNILVNRLKISEEHKESVLTELQHAQKLSSIGRLAAGVAHEINNPLAVINEKAGLLNDLIDLSDNFDKKSKFTELSNSIIKSIERCRKITSRLLGFSRRIDVKIESIQVNDIIHEVIGFLEKETLYRKIDLILNLSDSVQPVFSDHGQLQQVFLNLLTNALAAVEDELGTIEIETKNNITRGVIIKINDNGCGMSQETIEKIFDPFFTTKKKEGTGLGLSISYGIIKKLGGKIFVESEPEKGTVFIIHLPEGSEEMETNHDRTKTKNSSY